MLGVFNLLINFFGHYQQVVVVVVIWTGKMNKEFACNNAWGVFGIINDVVTEGGKPTHPLEELK